MTVSVESSGSTFVTLDSECNSELRFSFIMFQLWLQGVRAMKRAGGGESRGESERIKGTPKPCVSVGAVGTGEVRAGVLGAGVLKSQVRG